MKNNTLKISHELPLSLLKYGYKWNDYDYLLPIFADKYPEYRMYFINAKRDGRFIIMDNSLFEGYVHTTEDLLSKIHIYRPNIFIVPDAWNDSTTTLINAKQWMNIHKPNIVEGCELMAVCQGKNLDELTLTYNNLLSLGYKHIAINHSSIAYQDMYPDLSLLNAQMYGRIKFIRHLLQTGILDKTVYHHLLGSSNWIEFQSYTEYKWIKSCDTSAPIINGALGNKFNHTGIYIKPKEKLEDIIEIDLSDKLDIIKYNVGFFRKSLS